MTTPGAVPAASTFVSLSPRVSAARRTNDAFLRVHGRRLAGLLIIAEPAGGCRRARKLIGGFAQKALTARARRIRAWDWGCFHRLAIGCLARSRVQRQTGRISDFQ
jgi:hypothetical protein